MATNVKCRQSALGDLMRTISTKFNKPSSYSNEVMPSRGKRRKTTKHPLYMHRPPNDDYEAGGDCGNSNTTAPAVEVVVIAVRVTCWRQW